MTPFWQLDYTGIAVVDHDGSQISYPALAKKADACAAKLGKTKQLILAQARNTLDFLTLYLACLRHGHILMLQPPTLKTTHLTHLCKQYHPHWHFNHTQRLHQHHKKKITFSDQLQLLLTTSGSTGSCKQVMLSAANLMANTESICTYLPLSATDRAMTSLPAYYSYGLSVINTHLQVGATLVLSHDSLLTRNFWQTFDKQQITSLSGVPASYDLLLRLHFERIPLPSLRYLTQAGGALAPEKVAYITHQFAKRHIPFYVMYGQTEATARIAWLPPEQTRHHPDCIGQAIPGGKLGLRDIHGDHFTPAREQTGELIYQGKNIMLGYATQLADLAQVEPKKTLATGDIAQYVGQHIYRIIGRENRIVKIQGNRINLDELQMQLAQDTGEVVCSHQQQKLVIHTTKDVNQSKLHQQLQEMRIHPSLYHIKTLAKIPRTPTGKIHYQELIAYE